MVSIDGTNITGATIDGQQVSEITIDGQTAWTTIPDSGVSRLRMNNKNNDTSIANDVWGSNDGTVSGGATYLPSGGPGGSGAYDGGHITLPLTSIDLPASFGGWLYVNSVNSGHIFGNYANTSSDDVFNNEFSFDLESIGASFSNYAPITTGSWIHWVVTIDSNESVLYLNGTQSETSVGGTGTLSNGNNYCINGAPGTTARDQNAVYDDWRLYSKKLTSTEVSNWHNTGSI